jgi:ribulose-phosphate 3-epimerase
VIKVAPSIASADQSKLAWAVQEAEKGGADLIHLDIEDGVFIPNITFGVKTVRQLRPFSGLPFDVHLEVSQPEGYFEAIVKAGADIVTVQVESTRFPYRAVYLLKQLGVKAGLAFNAATSLEALPPIIDDLDVILLMTAEPNGSTDHFMAGILEKVRRARELVSSRSIEIEVDGGIGQKNARLAAEAGASVLVAGRAIWGEEDPGRAIQELRRAAEEPIHHS